MMGMHKAKGIRMAGCHQRDGTVTRLHVVDKNASLYIIPDRMIRGLTDTEKPPELVIRVANSQLRGVCRALIIAVVNTTAAYL